MADVPNDLLGRLTGCRLLSVEFILDHLQLRFDSDVVPTQPVLMCDELPTVATPDGQLLNAGRPGWADTLIALIGRDVTATMEAPRSGVRIDLDDYSIVLNPESCDDLGPEIATLSGFPDQQWVVWRPGEESFEHLTDNVDRPSDRPSAPDASW